MIVLHYRAIPGLRHQVQQAIAASARDTPHPPSARRLSTAAAPPAGARLATWPFRPRSLRRRAAACTQTARPGPTAR
jgi:hypothetical protein